MIPTEVIVSIVLYDTNWSNCKFCSKLNILVVGRNQEEGRQEQPTLTMGSLRGKNLPPTGPDITGKKKPYFPGCCTKCSTGPGLRSTASLPAVLSTATSEGAGHHCVATGHGQDWGHWTSITGHLVQPQSTRYDNNVVFHCIKCN